MAIGAGAAGAWAASNATTHTVTLPAHAAGDLLLVIGACKAATIASVNPTITAGWQRLGAFADGTTTAGSGTGSVNQSIFYKIATSSSESNPVITWGGSQTAAPGIAVAHCYTKAAGEEWETPQIRQAATNSATSISVAMPTNPGITAGDWGIVTHTTRDDSALTVPTWTATSATLGTATVFPTTPIASATGNQMAGTAAYRAVSSGTATAVPTCTGTQAAAETGVTGFIRLRVYTPPTGTLIADDNFATDSVNSWATPTTGGAYTLAGTAANYDKALGVGTIVIPAGNVYRAHLLTTSAADAVGMARFRYAGAAASSLQCFIMLRSTDSAGSFNYCGGIVFDSDNTVRARINEKFGPTGGEESILVNSASLGAYAPGDEWWAKFEVVGTTLRVKGWAVNANEPGSWSASTTDATLTTGHVGLRPVNGGGASVTVTVDDFRVWNTGAASVTVTPTTAALVTATFAPTVTLTGHQLVTPTTATLTTARFIPTVTTGGLTAPAGTGTTDNFIRTVTDGWGTSSGAGEYDRSGTASQFSVSGGVGYIKKTVSTTAVMGLYPGQSESGWAPPNADGGIEILNLDTLVALRFPVLATTSGANIEVTQRLRTQRDTDQNSGTSPNPTDDFYFVSLIMGSAANAWTYELSKLVVNSATVLTSGSTGITATVNEWWWVRSQAIGTSPTTIRFRLWKYGDAEPGTWIASTTDSEATLQIAGGWGSRLISAFGVGVEAHYTGLTITTVAVGTTVTPGPATLTTATFAPQLQLTLTPAKLSLVTATFAPVLRSGLTPAPAALVTATFAPQLRLTLIPAPASLALTTFAPTVTALNAQLVTPAPATLVSATFAPVLRLAVIPATAAISSATFAPVIRLTLTPGVASLTTATFAPVLRSGLTASPAALVTTTFAPTVTASAHQIATPTPASLALTTFAPSAAATGHITLTPAVAGLSVALTAPILSVTAHITLIPAPAALTTTAHLPTVTAFAGQTIVPPVKALALSTFAPTIATTAHQTAVPSTAALTLAAFAPLVTASAHQIATPPPAVLTSTRLVPTVTATAGLTLVPAPPALALTTFAPVVAATAHQTAVPAKLSLALTTFVPGVVAGAGLTLIPTPRALALTTFAPSPAATNHQLVTAQPTSLVTVTFAVVIDLRLPVPVRALTTATFAPVARIGQYIIPAANGLTLTTFAPLITAPAPQTFTPASASLVTTRFAPLVVIVGAIGTGLPGSIRAAGDTALRISTITDRPGRGAAADDIPGTGRSGDRTLTGSASDASTRLGEVA